MRLPLATLASLAAACGGDPGGDSPDAGDQVDAGVNACDVQAGWALGPALPLGATQETAVVALDGRIYVVGGFNGTGGILAQVQVYDTATCTWSLGPELPIPIHHANVAVVDGTVYVVGAMVTISFRAIGNVWAWNPTTDAGWTARTSMPSGTERGSAVVGAIGGRIYVAGGLRGSAVAEVSAYDPTGDAWDTNFPALPQPTDHGCGGVIAGKLYVAGGRRGAIDSITGALYEYMPGGAWATKTAMTTPRGGTACAVVGDRLFVIGGEGNGDAASGVFPQVEAYTATSDVWESLPPMPTPRHGMGAAAWDGRVYVPGGATRAGFGATEVHEVLTP